MSEISDSPLLQEGESKASDGASAAGGAGVQLVGAHLEMLPAGVSLKAHIENIEIALIRRALVESKGVVAHAAERLRIRRTTLAEKMKRYGIVAKQAEPGTM